MSILLTNILSTFQIIATILYIIGLIFLIVEVFIPGFGFFGISGISLLVISIIVKICLGDSVTHILLSILIAFAIIIVLLIWIIISAKKGLISKSSLISNGTSIPTFYNDDNLKVFIDKEGETVTTCKPVGKVRIDDEIYDVQSLDGFLEIGTKVKVIEVNDNMLKISKIKGEEK
ncbi:MAG: hypothetical protein E7359_04565 [Clostridiales bacterium]|nr:hypothetical protein [Clostridiales bacterium]